MQALLTSRSRIWISRILMVGFLAVVLLSQSVWSMRAPLFKELLVLTGFVLVALGVIGRVWAGSYICGIKNVQLVNIGPYSITRNPLYFFSFVAALGITLTTATLTIPLVFIVVFFAYYIPVMKKEERHLSTLHTTFPDYARSVPRFWPKWSLYKEPETYVVTSKYYRRFLNEVVWFIIAAAIIHFFTDEHVLPAMFNLY